MDDGKHFGMACVRCKHSLWKARIAEISAYTTILLQAFRLGTASW